MKPLFAVAAGVSLLGAVACSDSSSSTSPTPLPATPRASLPSIVETAVSSPDLSTLVAALERADLVSTFDGSNGSFYTVFAPTNAAFDAAAGALIGPGSTGMDLVNALDVATLTGVLAYHATIHDRPAGSVVAGGSLTMLDGNTATVTVAGGVPMIEDAAIVTTDILASNGYVHVIDAVILPPTL